MASNLALVISLSAFFVFGYATYFLNFDHNVQGIHKVIPLELKKYGQLKWLTYQCLLIQLLNAALHVLAHFSRSFVGLRDFVFSTLAYPVSSIVVYSFWAVWHLMSRELIFPKEASLYYPDWLNHITHSISVPINIALALLINHKYSSNGAAFTLLYLTSYTALLHFIKFDCGRFVYKYLEAMSDAERLVYFAATGLVAYLMYKMGEYLTRFFHGPAGHKPTPAAGKKMKQK